MGTLRQFVAALLGAATAVAPVLPIAAAANSMQAAPATNVARPTLPTLYGQESAARGRVHSARQSLIQIINLAFPRLTVIYPKQKALVESFFYKPAKGDLVD